MINNTKQTRDLPDLFTTFIELIDYFNNEKPGNGIMAFEFGSYILSDIDYWLFVHNQHRKEIMAYLTTQFLIYCSELLSMPSVQLAKILNHRLSLYEQLKRETRFGTAEFSGAHYDKYYSVISDIILTATKESRIIEFSSIEQVPCELNIGDKFRLTMNIIAFQINMLDSFYKQIGELKLATQ